MLCALHARVLRVHIAEGVTIRAMRDRRVVKDVDAAAAYAVITRFSLRHMLHCR